VRVCGGVHPAIVARAGAWAKGTPRLILSVADKECPELGMPVREIMVKDFPAFIVIDDHRHRRRGQRLLRGIGVREGLAAS
jgi:tartrate dehydratase beta subunit/fumarate hydratase class I family protein